MSDYPNVDLLIEAIDEEPAGPLTSVGVALVRKGWAHGQEVAEAEISTLRQQLDQALADVARLRKGERGTTAAYGAGYFDGMKGLEFNPEGKHPSVPCPEIVLNTLAGLLEQYEIGALTDGIDSDRQAYQSEWLDAQFKTVRRFLKTRPANHQTDERVPGDE